MNDDCCDNVCSMANGEALEDDFPQMICDFQDDYGSSSSTAELGTDWHKMNDKEKLDFIRRDCLARIEDVKITNKTKKYSAFLSIPATIGYFSKLAYSYNKALGTSGKLGEDRKRFLAFCDKYILKQTVQRNFHSELSRVLYAMRCGLIHGASLVCSPTQTALDKKDAARQCEIHISITQCEGNYPSLQEINRELAKEWRIPHKPVPITLYSGALCDALEDAADAMCDDTDHEVSDSIIKVFEKEPPILCVKLQ